MYGPGFSVVETKLNFLPRLSHLAFASASASAKRGSFPLGKAPAWRETTKVSVPAEIDPVLVVAQPTNSAAIGMSSKRLISYLLKFSFFEAQRVMDRKNTDQYDR
jgi:hypothetical protein